MRSTRFGVPLCAALTHDRKRLPRWRSSRIQVVQVPQIRRCIDVESQPRPLDAGHLQTQARDRCSMSREAALAERKCKLALRRKTYSIGAEPATVRCDSNRLRRPSAAETAQVICNHQREIA